MMPTMKMDDWTDDETGHKTDDSLDDWSEDDTVDWSEDEVDCSAKLNFTVKSLVPLYFLRN